MLTYYEDAASETTPKKESALKKLWEKILAFIEKIKDFFKGKKTPESDGMIDESTEKKLTLIQKFKAKWGSAMKHPGVKIAAITAAILLLVGGCNKVKKTVKKVKISKAAAKNGFADCEKLISLSEAAAKNPANQGEDTDGKKGAFAKAINKLFHPVKDVMKDLTDTEKTLVRYQREVDEYEKNGGAKYKDLSPEFRQKIHKATGYLGDFSKLDFNDERAQKGISAAINDDSDDAVKYIKMVHNNNIKKMIPDYKEFVRYERERTPEKYAKGTHIKF